MAAEYSFKGLCKKVFHGASRQIKFGWRHLFSDFAKRNQKKMSPSKEYFAAEGG